MHFESRLEVMCAAWAMVTDSDAVPQNCVPLLSHGRSIIWC